MAEAKKSEAEGDAPAPKKKGKMMLFIIIGVVVLVLGGGGAVYMMMAKKKAAAEAEAEGDDEDAPAKHEKAKKKDKKDSHAAAPSFYKFDKPFTVKLVADQQDAYLQVELQLRVLDPAAQESLKQYDPELKHKITLLLLGKKAAELNTAQGVQKLSNEIRDVCNNTLEPPKPKKGKAKEVVAEAAEERADPSAPVQAVLFTTFIVQ